MGRFYTYLGVMLGLMLVFHFVGLIETGATPNSQLLQILLNIEDISFSDFFTDYILLSITTATGLVAGILIGFVSKNIELAAMVSVTVWIATVMWDFIQVYAVIASYNVVFATLIFAPILFMFSLSMVDWWRGRDV